MRLLDLSSEPSIPHLVDMLRDITRAEHSAEVMLAFFQKYRSIRPVDAFVGVAPADGGYRILYRFLGELPDWRGQPRAPITPDPAAPLHRGGFIGEMTTHATPKFALDLSLADDPVLGDLPPGLRTCMILPLFTGDRVEGWTFAFSRQADGFRPEDVSRALLTANLLGAATRHLDTMQSVTRLHRQLRDQLDQVARVQQSLLPARTPDIPGLEITTSYLPSDLAGGDYYDFFRLPGERWGLLIADVSGHGAAAATIMAMLHAILHAYAPLEDPHKDVNPAAVMEFANSRLVAAGLEGAFVTAFFGIFDPLSGRLTYSNAGHPPPRLKRGADGAVRPIEDAATLPLGIIEPLAATTGEVTLTVNDTLVLYTDGITEAFDPAKEMFGTQRLDDTLDACTGAPDCVVESVHRALFDHRGSSTRDDDQTLLAVRFHGLCKV